MSEVRVTVLGSSGSYPGGGRACSSYLVTSGGYRLLLDCGNGALSNLPCDHADIDAIVLSHTHPDHCVDIFGMDIALRYGPRPSTVDVYAPAGAGEQLSQLLVPDSREAFLATCRFHEVGDGDALELGPASASFRRVAHPVEAVASRLEVDGRILAYSGDSGPTPALVASAKDADLFMCDSSWPERAGPYPPGVHCTGLEAGEMAAQAGAARLLVTHVQPQFDPAELAAEAASVFDGEIIVARDGQEIVL